MKLAIAVFSLFTISALAQVDFKSETYACKISRCSEQHGGVLGHSFFGLVNPTEESFSHGCGWYGVGGGDKEEFLRKWELLLASVKVTFHASGITLSSKNMNSLDSLLEGAGYYYVKGEKIPLVKFSNFKTEMEDIVPAPVNLPYSHKCENGNQCVTFNEENTNSIEGDPTQKKFTIKQKVITLGSGGRGSSDRIYEDETYTSTLEFRQVKGKLKLRQVITKADGQGKVYYNGYSDCKKIK